MNLQSQTIHVHNIYFFKQCICILEDCASGEKVGDIEKIIVKNLLRI